MNWIDSLKNTNSVQKYIYLTKRLQESKDVAADREFQKKCNGFFRIRRNAIWQKEYYAILQIYKNSKKSPDYKTILQKLYDKTEKIEKSFASKLLHMLNNDLPILDSVVLNNLDINARFKPKQTTDEKIEHSCKVYAELKDKIYSLRDSTQGKEIIRQFRNSFDKYVNELVSDTKIIDFYLWTKRN